MLCQVPMQCINSGAFMFEPGLEMFFRPHVDEAQGGGVDRCCRSRVDEGALTSRDGSMMSVVGLISVSALVLTRVV